MGWYWRKKHTVRMPNRSFPQFRTCNNQLSVWLTHRDVDTRYEWNNHKRPNKRVEVRTGTKQINHEVSIRKNNGGMNHGVEGRQDKYNLRLCYVCNNINIEWWTEYLSTGQSTTQHNTICKGNIHTITNVWYTTEDVWTEKRVCTCIISSNFD